MKQVSVYTANRKGAMYRLTHALADAGVDIRALVTNDSAEFGTIRMIVDQPDVAIDALNEAGYLCQLTDVIGVVIDDKVGGLDKLLADIDYMNISVDYIYICYDRLENKVIAVIHTDVEIETILARKGWCIAGE